MAEKKGSVTHDSPETQELKAERRLVEEKLRKSRGGQRKLGAATRGVRVRLKR